MDSSRKVPKATRETGPPAANLTPVIAEGDPRLAHADNCLTLLKSA